MVKGNRVQIPTYKVGYGKRPIVVGSMIRSTQGRILGTQQVVKLGNTAGHDDVKVRSR